MAKNISAVLKLKDQFSSPLKKAAKSVDTFKLKEQHTDYQTRKFADGLKKNLASSARRAAAAVGAAGAAAAVASYKMVTSAAETADTIDESSQKLGLNAKSYQELNYVMSQSGMSIDSFKSGSKSLLTNMTKMTQGNKDSVAAFKTLGVSVTDSKGNLRDVSDVTYDSIRAFQKMKNGSEKSALAIKLFGKSGQNMAAILNADAGSFDETIKKANDLGLVMSDSTVKSGAELNDTLDTLKTSFGMIAIQLGTQLVPYFQKAADYIIKKMPVIRTETKKVAGVFDKFAGAVKWCYDNSAVLIPILGGAVAGFAAFKVISTVTTLMTVMSGIMTVVTGEQVALNAALFTCPITWIVLGIAAAVAAGIALYKNWDKVCAWADKLKKKFNKLISPIKKVAGWLGKVFGFSGKSVDVKVDKTTTTTKTPKHALGSTYFAGGYTGYSENGRAESAVLPSGTKIIPADKTRRGTDKTGGVNVYLTIQGNMIGNEKYMRESAEYTGRMILDAIANV